MRRVIVLFLLVVIHSGCSKKGAPKTDVPAARPIMEVLREDLDTITLEDFSHLTGDFKKQHEQIFGGTSGADVRRYLKERIGRYVAEDSFIRHTPEKFRHEKWSTPKTKGSGGSERGMPAAFNLSTGLYLAGLIDDREVSLEVNGERVSITKIRPSVVVLGKIYTAVFSVGGQYYTLHPMAREEILAHEARHADCTKGIKSTHLEAARGADSFEDFDAKVPELTCGHFHSVCPPKHQLEGIPACDSRPWGAYAIGWRYTEAHKIGFSNLKDWEVQNALSISNKSRLLYDSKKLLRGELGEPDMSSSEAVL